MKRLKILTRVALMPGDVGAYLLSTFSYHGSSGGGFEAPDIFSRSCLFLY